MPSLVEAVERLIQKLLDERSLDPMNRMMKAHLFSGGKRLRARMVLDCTKALGGSAQEALGAAAAVELLHNATLIHDDVQDGDEVRRGVPTLWVTDGVNQAINAGDMMLMLPQSAIATMTVSDSVKWKISLALAEAAQYVVMGQALEPELKKHVLSEVILDKYLDCIRGKTAALFSFAIQSACLITGKTSKMTELSRDFEKLGLLFQIQDDVLDLYGDKGRGRAGEDLREGKISMLAVQYMKLHPKRANELVNLLVKNREETSQSDVEAWINRLRDEGALASTLEYMKTLVKEIEGSSALAQEPALKELMSQLISKVLEPIQEVWRA